MPQSEQQAALPGSTEDDVLNEAEALVPQAPKAARKNRGGRKKTGAAGGRQSKRKDRNASSGVKAVQADHRGKERTPTSGREFWSSSGHLLSNDTPAAHVLNSDLHEKAKSIGHITADQVLYVDKIPSKYASARALTEFLRTQSVRVTSASVAQRKDERGELLANASWAVVTLPDPKAAKAAVNHCAKAPFTVIGDETPSGGRNVDVKLSRYDGQPNELHDETFTKMMANRLKLVGIKQNTRFMMLPDSDFRYTWNILLLVFCIYVAIAVPIRAAFRVELCPGSLWDRLDLITDCFFWADIVLSFRTAIVDDKYRVIDDPREVAKTYAKGWLLVDLFAAVGPVVSKSVSAGANESLAVVDCPYGKAEPDQPTKAVKALRLMRLVHLVRLRRFAHLAVQVEGKSDVASSGLQAGRNLKARLETLMRRVWQMQIIQILSVAHLFGCIWYAVGMLAYSGGDTSNLVPAPDEDTGWIAYAGITNETSVMERYLTSCYWAVTVLTTVGYGDIFAITVEEKIFSLCAEMFGCMVFAYLISTLSATTMEQTLVAERVSKRMAEVEEWFKQKSTPLVLQGKIKLILEKAFTDSAFDEEKIIKQLPAGLRQEVEKHDRMSLRESTAKIPLFADVMTSGEEKLANVLMKVMHPLLFQSGDVIYAEGSKAFELYVINSGQVTLSSSFSCTSYDVEEGSFFGDRELFFKRDQFGKLINSFDESETMILDAQTRHHEARVTSVLIAELKFIDWTDLLNEIVNSDTDKGIEIMQKIRYKAFDDWLRDEELIRTWQASRDESESSLRAKVLKLRDQNIEEYLKRTHLYSDRQHEERVEKAKIIQRHWKKAEVKPEQAMEPQQDIEQVQSPVPKWRTERGINRMKKDEDEDEISALRRDVGKMLTLLTDLDSRVTHTQRQVNWMYAELTEKRLTGAQ